MSIVSLLITLIIIGFVIYMIQTLPIPISPWFKNLIMGVIGIVALIWVLGLFGIDTGHLRIR